MITPLRRLLFFFGILAFTGCDPLELSDGPFQYPLSLQAENDESLVQLTWNEATVSTFQEYVIVRSTNAIPDSPEPEITGGATILARIDERQLTSFEDSTLPLSDSLFYKVYARIGDRFLMSPTIRIQRNLHLLSARADVVRAVPERQELIMIDRATQQLLIYHYPSREIVRSKAFNQMSFPVIRYNAKNTEILLYENSTTMIVDYETLNFGPSTTNVWARSIDYVQDWVYAQKQNFPYQLAIFRRSDLSQRGELNVLQSDWRNFVVIPDAVDANKSLIYDFAVTGAARYIQEGAQLEVDLVSSTPLNASVVAVRRPHHTEFIATHTGQVVNGNFETIAQIGNNQNGFSQLTYSPDGNTFFGLFFPNNAVLQVYDASNDYSLMEEYSLSAEISPMTIFADDTHVHVVSLAFVNGTTQTLISTFAY